MKSAEERSDLALDDNIVSLINLFNEPDGVFNFSWLDLRALR